MERERRVENYLERDDILAYVRDKQSNWRRRLISYLSGRYYHVAIVFSPQEKLILEANSVKGVWLRPIQKDRVIHVFRLIPTEFDSEKAWKWALSDKVYGRGYDYLGLAGTIWHWAILNAKRRYICSELVDDFFKAGGVEVSVDGNGLRTPGEVVASPYFLYMGKIVGEKIVEWWNSRDYFMD